MTEDPPGAAENGESTNKKCNDIGVERLFTIRLLVFRQGMNSFLTET